MTKRLFFTLFLICINLHLLAASHQVCLNMIVKNEKDVIERCLDSVLPIIDYWVIVDTGSTDGTQDIIKNFMEKKGVDGELHERPWVNFGHNRNEALDLAKSKADYIFFIDADEYVVYEPGFVFPHLDKDYYFATLTAAGSKWSKVELIKDSLDWRWEGAIHEVIAAPANRSSATLENMHIVYTSEGARSKDPKKYEKDAELLEKLVSEDPTNSRYIFYLAQSYLWAQIPEKALLMYEKRASMSLGPFDSEAFWSLLQIARIKESLEKPDEEVIKAYFDAFSHSRNRQEPLYNLSQFYRNKGDFQKAYDVASIGLSIGQTRDILFIDQWIYDYGLLLEHSISAYWIGKYKECQQESLMLLANKNLPENVLECAEQNLGFANMKLVEAVIFDEN